VAGLTMTTYGVAFAYPRRAGEADHAAQTDAAQTLAVSASQAASTCLDSALRAKVWAPQVRASVAAADQAAGASAVFAPTQTFQSASIVKVGILAVLLLHAQDARRTLTAEERGLAQQMIVHSDNDAASTLWRTVGGATAITTALRRLGLTATVADTRAWGKTTTTAMDELRLVMALLEGGGPFGTAAVTQARQLMGSVAGDQDWGISAATAGEAVYLKNGWVTRDDDGDRWIVHSVGAIKTPAGWVSIVVLSDGHASLEAGVEFVEQAARLTRACLGT
jgi:beta-lactamase class A